MSCKVSGDSATRREWERRERERWSQYTVGPRAKMNQLRLPRLKRSLCGLSLETGAKIVSYLHLTGILGGFLTAFVLEVSFTEVRRPTKNASHFEFLFYRDELMLASIFNVMVVAALYIYGTKRRDTTFMEPLLITKGTLIILEVFNLGLSVISRMLQYKDLTIFYELISFAVESYMFTLLYSFYHEVRNTGSSVYEDEEEAAR